jgi:hypothetical protein
MSLKPRMFCDVIALNQSQQDVEQKIKDKVFRMSRDEVSGLKATDHWLESCHGELCDCVIHFMSYFIEKQIQFFYYSPHITKYVWGCIVFVSVRVSMHLFAQ